jgi:hypothetical protein
MCVSDRLQKQKRPTVPGTPRTLAKFWPHVGGLWGPHDQYLSELWAPGYAVCVCGSPKGDLSHIASLTLGCPRSQFFRSHSEFPRPYMWGVGLTHCVVQICRYGEAPAAAASWRAHDGRRQRGTACPLLYRYRLTHTYCSLARLPPTHPFVGAPILQRHFQVQWRARLPPPRVLRVLLPHTCTQDGWFLQPKRRPARLPRRDSGT